MTIFNKELMSTFLKGENILEVIRNEVENTVNELPRLVLKSFLDYEHYDPLVITHGIHAMEIFSKAKDPFYRDYC